MVRRAFTLIELLLVVAIIAVLAGMLFGAASMIRERARSLDTSHRLQAVLDGLAVYGQSNGDAATALQAACGLGGVISFASVDLICNNNAGKSGRANPLGLYRPDNSGQLWDINDWWQSQQNQAYWNRLQEALPPKTGPVPPEWYETTWPYTWPDSDWDQPTPGGKPPILRFAWGRPGLRLDGSPCDPGQDPDAVSCTVVEWKDLWSYQNDNFNDPSRYDRVPVPNRWAGTGASDPGSPIRYDCGNGQQTQPAGGAVVGTRSDGSTVDVAANAALPFDLGLCSPLRTIELLQAAEILPPGDEGAASFRSDRGHARSWNDSWGHPLVVTYALFQPERFKRHYDGQNRRDLFLKNALPAYGFNRSVYLAAAAVGPRLDPDTHLEDLAGSSSAATDAAMLRRLWRQARTVCSAQDWTERAFTAPPWAGVREKKAAGMRCFVTAPIELH